MFVIRDHFAEDTPLSALRDKIMDGIGKVWQEVRKPEKFKVRFAHSSVWARLVFLFPHRPT